MYCRLRQPGLPDQSAYSQIDLDHRGSINVRYLRATKFSATERNDAMCHKGTCGEFNSATVILNADTL